MTGKTHIVGGICAGLLFSEIASISLGDTAICVSLAANAALLPDIDTATSTISKNTEPLSRVFCLFGHRTIFHAPLFYVLLYGFLSRNFLMDELWISSIMVGIASHLILDMANKKGIPLLFPFPTRFHILSWPNGGKGEKTIRFICKLLSAIIFLHILFR